MDFFGALSDIRIGSISLGAILAAAVVICLCFIAKKIINKIFAAVMERSPLDGSLKSFLCTAVNVAVWAFIIIIAAETVGIPSSSLVAALSVAGLALSLSIQGILGNLFSGMIMMGTRPFHDGDTVDIGGTTGTVKSLGLFYTVLETPDRRSVHIPNSTVASSKVINFSTSPLRRIDLTVSASYEDDTEAVKNAILEACGQAEGIVPDPAPNTFISDYGASSIVYTIQAWANNLDYFPAKAALTEKVRESFKKNGVQMTFDHVIVHIDK